eukprot:TRINITY_DN2682_c0_g1_i1.p1 TRINITY_DN2682_c0_g1~~TRINITY_DN2682_c0_g1_i1.p1  ORF type:complete len:218 (+),score=24.14 TRINITY_DN2682_c0_g1_i1:206-859(+)
MPIGYALVARQDVILCHYMSSSGNFGSIASYLLKQIPPTDDQRSYEYEGHLFHYIVNDGITFLCVTDQSFDRRIALAFLFDTKTRFLNRFSEDLFSRATALALNGEFSTVLANQMDYYSHNPAADKINQVKNQLDNTRKLMFENVEKLQAKTEKLDHLERGASQATSQAARFKENAKLAKRSILMRKYKYWGFLVVLGLVMFWLFLSLFCGLSLKSC